MSEAQGDLLVEETSQTETTSWYSDEYKDVVQRCGWKGPNDVVKSYRELEKLDSGKIKIPSQDSPSEEIRKFYSKIGCPEKPEDYKLNVPEEVSEVIPRDEAFENVMKKIAYENGVSSQAFDAIVRNYYEKVANDLRLSREQGESALKEQYGDKYPEVLNVANKFFTECSPEFRDILKQSGLANNPVFVNEFYKLGQKTLSDTLIKGEQAGGEEPTYEPRFKNSPQMYANGDDEESQKARAYFEARGYKY